jgi:thiamine pyrophosphate-dependent acetolactate synthase large subunit-like protein
MTNPDFAQLAKAMRCHAIYCDQKDDLKAKIDELMAFDNSRPVLLHVKVTDKFVPPPFFLRCFEQKTKVIFIWFLLLLLG